LGILPMLSPNWMDGWSWVQVEARQDSILSALVLVWAGWVVGRSASRLVLIDLLVCLFVCLAVYWPFLFHFRICLTLLQVLFCFLLVCFPLFSLGGLVWLWVAGVRSVLYTTAMARGIPIWGLGLGVFFFFLFSLCLLCCRVWFGLGTLSIDQLINQLF